MKGQLQLQFNECKKRMANKESEINETSQHSRDLSVVALLIAFFLTMII